MTNGYILIDTLLYTPRIFVYNIDMSTKSCTVYDAIYDTITNHEIKKTKDNHSYIRLSTGHTYYLDLLVDIREKGEWKNDKK